MATKPCPECGSSDRKQETGEYALLALKRGKLQLHVDRPNANPAVVVRATVCEGCGNVALYEAA